MGGGFGFGIPGLGMIFFWGLIILLVVWAVRGLDSGTRDGGRTAREILDERFARGEIDQQEYEQRKRELA